LPVKNMVGTVTPMETKTRLANEERFDIAVSGLSEIPTPGFILTSDRRILLVTRAFERTMGRAAVELVGRRIDGLAPGRPVPAAAVSGEGGEARWRFEAADGRALIAHSHTARLATRAGEPVWLTLLESVEEDAPTRRRASPQRGEGRWTWAERSLRSLRYSAVRALTDVLAISRRGRAGGERGFADRRLAALRGEDRLTGLTDRRLFQDRLAREERRAQDACERLGLLIIDIDHFKPFNDLYGSAAGDAALRAVAQAIRQAAFRASDLPARFRDEGFAMLARGLNENGGRVVGERVRKAVEALAIQHAGSPFGHLTVSVGVAAVDFATVPRERAALIERADCALYLAKTQGRNRVENAAPPVEVRVKRA
jgi:diguanylate cyclase (GGDEF)-like protein